MKRLAFLFVFLSIMLVFAACEGSDNNNPNTEDNDSAENNQDAGNESVKVNLENGDEESVGEAALEEVSEGVKITLDGKNISKGTHGFHIHEKGVCETPDFKSAEGHFNPGDTNHGFDDPDGPHAGDLPNIVVGEDGTVHQSYVAQNVTLEEGEDNSLLGDEGTSLVIHKGADDGESQPSGDAGDRFACGTIEK